jgi:hypothetical protein
MTNQPLDADAVLRDDALLDALGRGELLPEYGDDAAARMLLAWRDDIADTAGLPESKPVVPVRARSIGTAKVPPPRSPREDDAAEQPRRLFHPRMSGRVAVAAAVAAIAAGSAGSVAAASVAEPGSPLWPITKVVYEDRAKSVEARESSLELLREARQAADRNDPVRARRLLTVALREAGDVDDKDDKNKIEDEADAVRAQLAALDEPVTSPSPSASPQAPAPSASPTPEPPPSPSEAPVPPPPDPEPSSQPPSPTPVTSPPATAESPPPTPEPSDGLAPNEITESTGTS